MGIQRRDISGNAGTATRLQTARNIGGVSFNGTADITLPGVNAAGNQPTSGNAATATTASLMTALDDREISPSEAVARRVQAVFTTWTNTNGASPYADGLLFNTYSDGSGGGANLLLLNKTGLGIRLYQQNYGVGTKFTNFKDVAWTDGTNATGTWPISIGGTAAGVSTAGALNATAGATVGAVGTYAFLRGVQANPGQTYSGEGLHYTGGVVETISKPVPTPSQWIACGYTFVADRGTLFLRVS